ncbi:MAG: histidine triad nucleotide-binding protein [Dehalococcoidia bacterium]|nr:MAG: histidine triad nucleotide-binding protein [Dehalococcoidia bacterium]
MDCIFCKIASGTIPADIVYSDGDFVAFRDISPQAPVHDVIIPRRHLPSINDLQEADQALAGKMLLVAKKVAEKEGIAVSGYRLAVNCGPDGTQVVPHIHLHVLGGRLLTSELG